MRADEAHQQEQEHQQWLLNKNESGKLRKELFKNLSELKGESCSKKQQDSNQN